MANVLIQPVSGAIQFNDESKGSSTVPDLSSNGIQLSQIDSSGLQVESHFGGLQVVRDLPLQVMVVNYLVLQIL